jgi:hypothetical protein
MATLYLKNLTGSEQVVNDLGLVIDDHQSIQIDENDINGMLTADMLTALASDSNPAHGLILSTTDVGDSSGDFPYSVAVERIALKTHWKPPIDTAADLPIAGNEIGDLRYVEATGAVYRWDQPTVSWIQITSGQTLTVTEIDYSPVGNNITKMVFVNIPFNKVYVDQPNNTAYIGAPTPPASLGGQSLAITGVNLVQAGLSQGNTNYKTSDPAGTVVSYDTNFAGTSVLSFTTPASTPSLAYCNYGQYGTISAWVNGTKIVTIDLAANFNTANQNSSQNIATDYHNTGSGNPLTSGVANFVGGAAGKGNLTVNSVAISGNFPFYQAFSATINITDHTIFQQGYNSIYMTHEGLASYGGTQTSNTIDLFYDIASTTPTVNVPTISEDTPITRYLSGVKYYDAGSTWKISFVGSHCFDDTYHPSGAPLVVSGWPGMSATPVAYNDSHVTGPHTPPTIGDVMTVANYGITVTTNQVSSNATVTVTPRSPYGSYTAQTSASQNILIWSYAQSSTPLVEYFRDEQYRLLNGTSYSTVPAQVTGVWNSQSSLVSYDDTKGLQLYLNQLVFPTLNFSTYYPSGNPDYSGLTSTTNRVYLRAFISSSISYAQGTLRLNGVTPAQLLAGNIKVEIKAPSQTGWLDLSKDYNFAIFTGVDGDGCWVNRDTQINSDFQFSLGQHYTQNSGYMVIVRVTYPSNASTVPVLTGMSITDWS